MPSAFERRQAARRQARLRLAAVGLVSGAVCAAAVGFWWPSVRAQAPERVAVAASHAPAAVAQRQPALQATPRPPAIQPVQASLPLADQPARRLTDAEITGGFAPMLNAARASEGLGPVVANRRLAQAAAAHARDMEARDFFDHVAPDGGTLTDRVNAAGYKYCVVAENIARGQRSLREVHEGWMNSPGHRANNLLPDITEFGIVLEDDTWVLVLGRSGC